MATYLLIDTTNTIATIGLSKAGQILGCKQNAHSNTHAEFVQVAIDQLCKESGISLKAIDAIVNVMGPGSYTGLRVGLASAKGIAFALNKPIIGLHTLQLLAAKAQKEVKDLHYNEDALIFSMIDARRLEVFGGFYHLKSLEVIKESPMILSETFFTTLIDTYKSIYCIGSGIEKSKDLTSSPQIQFIDSLYSLSEMIELADIKWNKEDFENLAYSSPIYLKEFYNTQKEK